jgi:hypothetical protein
MIVDDAKLKKCNRLWLTASDKPAARIYGSFGFLNRSDVMELMV